MSDLKHTFTWKLAASPAAVFAALTEPDQLMQWFAEHANVEPRVGGAYRFWGRRTYGAPGRAEATQRITRYSPNQALAFSWRLHECDSLVSFAIEPDGAGAAVVSGVHDFAEAPSIERARQMVDDLWRLNWGNLSAHLSGGQGLLLPDFSSRSAEVRLSIHIDAPPAAVFRSLIDPDKVQAWFGLPAAVDARAGGSWQLKMGIERDGVKQEAPPMRILEFVENERLAIAWPDWRGDPAVPDQRVLWVLTPEGEGTRVEFVHDGFVRAVDISDYPFGWGYFPRRIKGISEGVAISPVDEAHDC